MRKIFNIPDGKKTKLWIKHMTNTFECLARHGNSIQDAGLIRGQLVLIEQRNEDETWPQAGVTKSFQKRENSFKRERPDWNIMTVKRNYALCIVHSFL